MLCQDISAYRKGYSTITTLLAIRDDILTAMKKGEVTIVVIADFSKAFDTVAYQTIINKLHHIGFSKNTLTWVVSFLTDRHQFVQIDDKKSDVLPVMFGVPQVSILGPLPFNLYVNDLKCNQYADEITLYSHCKVSDLHGDAQ